MGKACQLAKDAQAERNCESMTFQIEKEVFLRVLNQAQAGTVEANKQIVDLKALLQKEIHLFKHVKYKHGYMD